MDARFVFLVTKSHAYFHCCANLPPCRDLKGCQQMDRGHCELWKPKGLLINRGFKYCKSNLHSILI